MPRKDDQYAKIAEKYDKHMGTLTHTLDEDFISIGGIKDPRGWNVLDIGCGTGMEITYLLKKFPQIGKIVGVDSSSEMIKIAKGRVKDERAEFIEEDMHKLEFPKNTFDFVYSKFSIHYSDNLKQLFSLINKITKQEGIFLFRDAHPLVGFFRKKSKNYQKKETVEFPISGGSNIHVKHPTFTVDEYVNTAIQTGWEIMKLVEEMGSQSKVLGVADFEIPTMMVLKLRKG